MIGEIRDKETSLIATQAALTGHLVLSTLHTNDAPSTITRLTNMGVEPLLINSTLLAVISQRLVRTYCTSCKGKATGCLDCYETGYKGRKALFEIFYMNDEIRRGVTQGASSYELKKLARQCGMRTLQESGQMLVEQGITSRKELSRVAAEV
jgi:type II secretory ATPase GspE/PulE/Tfp pilus assembly ATPase PilB-like protein